MFLKSRWYSQRIGCEATLARWGTLGQPVLVFPTAWRYQRTSGEVGTRWNTWKLPDEIARDVRLDGYPSDSPYPTRDTTFVREMLQDVRGQLDLIHPLGAVVA